MNYKELFVSKEHYLAFIQAWKKAANDKEVKLTSAHYALYAILRNKDWEKCFTPITNSNKLANGMYPNHGRSIAKYTLERYGKENLSSWQEAERDKFLSVFGGTISPTMLEVVVPTLDIKKHK